MSCPKLRTPAGIRGHKLVSTSLAALLLAGAALVGLGCSRTPGPKDFETQQTIDIVLGALGKGNYAFTPNPATCTRNTLIIWTNRDTIDHRIVSTGGFFDSGPIPPGQSYLKIFREMGNYRYHDEVPHSTLQGVLNVIS